MRLTRRGTAAALAGDRSLRVPRAQKDPIATFGRAPQDGGREVAAVAVISRLPRPTSMKTAMGASRSRPGEQQAD